MNFASDTQEQLALGPAEEVLPRMEGAFLDASEGGKPVVLLAVSADDLQLASRFCGADEDAVWNAVAGHLLEATAGHRLHACRDAKQLIVLLGGISLESAENLAQGLVAEARRLETAGLDQPIRVSLSVGLAENREDVELSFATLLAVAQEGLSVARARGGECVVHTMLYDLLQANEQRAGDGAVRIARRGGVVKQQAKEPVAAPAQVQPDSTDAGATPPPADLPEEELERRAREMAERMVAQVLEETKRSYEDRLRVAQEQAQTGQGEDIDRLRRRIRKLSESLERTERRLQEVSAMKDVDAGLSSVYREVQGLSTTEPDYELKLEMMRRLLNANLDLRQRVAS